MANHQLAVEERTQTGKGYARKLRANERIPAVIYGSGKASTTIEVVVRDVELALASQGSLIDLDLAGDSRTVIVKDIHRDPVRGTLQHVDFHEIDLTKKLEITVPIRVVGEEKRPGDGGVVQTLLWEVVVLCLPTDIPSSIEVDVSELELDHSIFVEDLDLPQGVEVLEEADEAVVKVSIPSEVDLGEADEADEELLEGEELDEEGAEAGEEAEDAEESDEE